MNALSYYPWSNNSLLDTRDVLKRCQRNAHIMSTLLLNCMRIKLWIMRCICTLPLELVLQVITFKVIFLCFQWQPCEYVWAQSFYIPWVIIVKCMKCIWKLNFDPLTLGSCVKYFKDDIKLPWQFLPAYVTHFLWNCIAMNASNIDSPLAQVMTWCCQATGHYQSQCWSRSVSLYDWAPNGLKVQWNFPMTSM